MPKQRLRRLLSQRMNQRRLDHRGVTAVLVAVLMSAVLVVSAAFAVDLGQQRVVRRDMQAIADVVALDLARLLNGGKASAYNKPTFDTAKNNSASRNDKALGGKLANGDVTWDFVKRDDDQWVVVSKTSTSETPTGVRVTATSDTSFAFGGVTGVARGGSSRTAVAQSDESACFRIGSYIAALDSSQSALLNPLLNGLLGSNLNLTAVGYQGLATSNISLLELVEVGGLGVGTVDELLALDNVAVGGLFIAAAKVLDDQGKLAQANILRAIAVAPGTPSIAIGDLISAAPGSPAALNATINVLDLITGAALVANDDHAVSVPNLGVTVPGLAVANATLHVIESPRTKCGGVGTTNETAQVRLEFGVHLNGQSISVLGNTLDLAPLDLAVSIDLGKAVAELKKVTCSESGPDSIRVDLESAVLGALSISGNVNVKGRIDPVGSLLGSVKGLLSLLGLGNLLNAPYLTLDTSLNLAAGVSAANSFDKSVTVPIPGGYTVPAGSGSGRLFGNVTLNPTLTTNVILHYWEGLLIFGKYKERPLTELDDVVTGVLSLLTPALTGLVNTVKNQLQTALVGPLQDLLGLQVGGADIFAVPTPTCSGPRLVG